MALSKPPRNTKANKSVNQRKRCLPWSYCVSLCPAAACSGWSPSGRRSRRSSWVLGPRRVPPACRSPRPWRFCLIWSNKRRVKGLGKKTWWKPHAPDVECWQSGTLGTELKPIEAVSWGRKRQCEQTCNLKNLIYARGCLPDLTYGLSPCHEWIQRKPCSRHRSHCHWRIYERINLTRS